MLFADLTKLALVMNGPPSYTGIWQQSSLLVVAAALTVSVITGGCSFIFSEGPPHGHEDLVYFDCGQGLAPPILDTIEAAGSALSANTASNNDKLTDGERQRAIAVGIALAVVTAASAVYGYSTVASCRQSQELRLARNMRQQSLPPPYGLPPYGQPPPTWPPPRFELKTPAAPPAPAQ
ncbi:MAG TPA: hypothetical protein VFH73_02250 [Polyangia bacterium]|nr:hypothetical protein [Polyangia bacterium]